jgi:hypothetical protein
MLRIFLAAIFMFIIGLTKAQDKIFGVKTESWSGKIFSQNQPNTSKAAATTFCGISYLLNSPTKKFSSKEVKIESFLCLQNRGRTVTTKRIWF